MLKTAGLNLFAKVAQFVATAKKIAVTAKNVSKKFLSLKKSFF